MEIVITSIAAFASTNIDDIFILKVFYGNKNFKGNEILTGQFLRIISLIGISLVGALLGLFISHVYIGLLGLIPIYLGIRGVLEVEKSNEETGYPYHLRRKKRNNILAVAGVTIANGVVGIYIPLFAILSWSNKITMVMVFLAMTFLWWLTAKFLTAHPHIEETLNKYGHRINPTILVALGFYILNECHTFSLLF